MVIVSKQFSEFGDAYSSFLAPNVIVSPLDLHGAEDWEVTRGTQEFWDAYYSLLAPNLIASPLDLHVADDKVTQSTRCCSYHSQSHHWTEEVRSEACHGCAWIHHNLLFSPKRSSLLRGSFLHVTHYVTSRALLPLTISVSRARALFSQPPVRSQILTVARASLDATVVHHKLTT
jgi:hypothetical protein